MDTAAAVPLRSVSTGGLGMSEASKEQSPGSELGLSLAISKKTLSSKINSAPADYVLVDGQAFRVGGRNSPRATSIESPRGMRSQEEMSKELLEGAALLASKGALDIGGIASSIHGAPDDASAAISTSTNIAMSHAGTSSVLRTRLAEATRFINKQAEELQTRDERIAELEALLREKELAMSNTRRSVSEGEITGAGVGAVRASSFASSKGLPERFREQVVTSNTNLPPTPEQEKDGRGAAVGAPLPEQSLSLMTEHTGETDTSFSGGGSGNLSHVPRSTSSELQSGNSNTSSPNIFITPTSADSLEADHMRNPYPFNESMSSTTHSTPENGPPMGKLRETSVSSNGSDGESRKHSPRVAQMKPPPSPTELNVSVGVEKKTAYGVRDAGLDGKVNIGDDDADANADLLLVGTDFHTPKPGKPPKGLAARLAMSSMERRRVSDASGGSSGGATPKSTSSRGKLKARLSDVPKMEPKYRSAAAKLTPRTAAKTSHLYLFHDNPQLGSSVAAKLEAHQGCELMMESKVESSGLTRFLVGRIIYSGSLQTMAGAKAASLANPRGSQCIQLLCAFAVQCDIKKLATRKRDNILEVDLRGENAESFEVSTPEEIKAFLSPCKVRVDVILDPIRDAFWFPYWETRRKMAPQFRSRGVGYIRLGDDMSRNGTAFLSTDVGETFLDDGAYEDEDTSSSAGFNGRSTFPGGETNRRAFSAGATNPHSFASTMGTMGDDGMEASKELSAPQCEVELRNILGQLDENSGTEELKWADRQALLRRLFDLFAGSPDTSTFPIRETITVLVQCIMKQKNPHVLRSAIACVRVVGDNISVLTVNAMAWRLLMVETMNLLKSVSKPVVEETRRTLNYLHSKCVLKLAGIASGGLLEDVFGSNRAPSRSGLGTPGSRSSPRDSGGRSTPTTPSTPGGGNTNCGRIITWLVEVVHRELLMALGEASRFRNSQEDLVEPVNLYDKCDAGNLACRSVHLLYHREESTRAAGSDFMAGLLALDVFQALPAGEGFGRVGAMLKKALGSRQPSGRLGSGRRRPGSGSAAPSAGEGGSTELTSLLSDLLSDSGRSALEEMSRSAPRALEKTVQSTSRLIVDMNDGKLESPVPGTSSATRATRPISGSSVPHPGERPARRTSAALLKAPSPVQAPGVSGGVSSEAIFFEANLVLQSLPATPMDWNVMAEVVEAAPDFFELLAMVSRTMGLGRGALIRQILPFDESTSSNDQADTGFDEGLDTLISSAEKAGLPGRTMVDLRSRALQIRKLIRVKMADEADVDQAIAAMGIVQKFCEMIMERSRLEGVSPVAVISTLG